MKKTIITAFIAITAITAPICRASIDMTVGSGTDNLHLIIEGFASSLYYAVAYTHNALDPWDSHDLMQAAITADAKLSAVINNFGTVEAPNYFLDSITYDGATLTNTGPPTYSPYWAQWVSGGDAGYPTATAQTLGSWNLGSGMSSPYRILEPNASDALVYGDGIAEPVTTAPIPEPSSVLLILFVASSLAIRRRRR